MFLGEGIFCFFHRSVLYYARLIFVAPFGLPDDLVDTRCQQRSCVVRSLRLADNAVIGWKQAIMVELDRMRAEMPYADTLELRLICERRDA